MIRVTTFSEAETIALGTDIARQLKSGDVVACYGELGSGKTSFIRGICQGLGVLEHVASPTFVLLREYHTNGLSVYHFDLYRIKSHEELFELGFNDFIATNGISLIEWAERAGPLLPLTRYDVFLKFGEYEHIREIEIMEIIGVKA